MVYLMAAPILSQLGLGHYEDDARWVDDAVPNVVAARE